ncbi:MAG: CBS domain-containing protein [Niabella sp.]
MLIKDLITDTIPSIKLSDPVHLGLQLMQDYHVTHLAVCDDEGKLTGIMTEDALLDADDQLLIQDITLPLPGLTVKPEEHFLQAVELAAKHHLSVVPVSDNAHNLQNSIAANTLLEQASNFMQLETPGALVVLEMSLWQYSLSQLCRIVEGNDAAITQLNTTKIEGSDNLLVTMRINKIEVSDIVAAFQRYEYTVRYYYGEELYTNDLKSNYENLMNYLNI